MNILWFSWKDTRHPQAGGAEAVSGQLMKRLAANGHHVRLITARYPGSSASEMMDGVEVSRVGGQLTVYPKAAWLFRRRMAKWPDLIIDEMNTLPFGCAIYSRKPSVLLTYQLARKVWFYQSVFPVSIMGYLIEPLYLLIMSRLYKTVLTESESTRTDLQRFGFAKKHVHVFRVGIELTPLKTLLPKPKKTILVLGALRPMKQTLDAVQAFELARDNDPAIELIIAGDNSGKYAHKVTTYISQSRHSTAIRVLGRVSKEKKLQLMQEATLSLVTSVKEGWGLIVTEANSQGTPAVAYDNDGLRDSIVADKTGLLGEAGNPQSLAKAINSLLDNPQKLKKMRLAAHTYSQQFTYENSYSDFIKILGIDK